MSKRIQAAGPDGVEIGRGRSRRGVIRVLLIVFSATLAQAPFALAKQDSPEDSEGIHERFLKTRDEAADAYRKYRQATETCVEIAQNETTVRVLNAQMAERSHAIGRLHLYIEELDTVPGASRTNVWRTERQQAHARSLALRGEQLEASRELSMRRAGTCPAGDKQRAILARKDSVADLRKKVVDLRKATDEVVRKADRIARNDRAEKRLAVQIRETRAFLKEAEAALRP